jgi:type IV secretion system protein VirB10
MKTNTIEAIEGDRGLPSVNNDQAGPRKGALLLFVLFTVVVIGGMLYFTVIRKMLDAEEKQPAKDLQLNSTVPNRVFSLPPQPPPAVEPRAIPVLADKPPLPGGGVAPPMAVPAPKAAEIDKSRSSLMLAGGRASGNASGNEPRSASIGGQQGEGPLSGMLVGTKTSPASARMLPDRNFLLTKGNVIECGLQTKLDSTVPGMLNCNTNRNVYSSNGRVLLLERGTRLTGEFRANLKQGQERLYVLWTRLETPSGVVVNLDSPGTDALGGAGVPGYVDTHFWQRFGGAILLTVANRAFDYAVAKANENSGTTIDTGGNTDASNIATEALRSTINIPPTLYTNHGERLQVYVARDLDFSTVYDLRIQ